MSPLVTHCELNPIDYGQIEVIVTLDGEKKVAFKYFSDELYFDPELFLGHTITTVLEIYRRACARYFDLPF